MRIKKSTLSITLLFCLNLFGCNQMGSITYWSLDKAGYVRPRDSYLNNHMVTEADVITISLNTIYLKYAGNLFEWDINNHVLVYAEVYDNPESDVPYQTVIYNEQSTTSDTILCVADRLIYGPIHYKGYPIQIKLYIIELDKKDKKVEVEILKAIGNVAAKAAPQYSPFIVTGVGVGEILAAFNQDDVELKADITFYPSKKNTVVTEKHLDPNEIGVSVADFRVTQFPQAANYTTMPLRSGNYLISKIESTKRHFADFSSKRKEFLGLDYWTYESPVREVHDVLNYKGGYLWYCAQYPSPSDPNKMLYDYLSYVDKTYAVFSIDYGGRQADEQKLRAISENNKKTVALLLQTNDPEDVQKIISDLGCRWSAEIYVNNIIDIQNDKVATDLTFRDDKQFVIGYIQELIEDPNMQSAKQINSLLIRIIRSTMNNFPLFYTDGNNWDKIKEVKKATKEDGRIEKDVLLGYFIWNNKE